jgi:hypothetical protein
MTFPEAPTSVERINIVDGCPAIPGYCAICGSVAGKMVDIGLDLEFYGTVYFCVDNCFKQIANVLEYFSPEQVTQLKEEIIDVQGINDRLVTDNGILRSAVSSIGDLSSLFSTGSDSISELVDDSESEAESESSEGDSGEITGRETGSAEQDDESGSSDVYYDDSIRELGL